MSKHIPRIKLKESYDNILYQFKSPINFLEIGLDTGISLEKWKEYFPVGSIIYGIDIDLTNLKCSLSDFHIYEIDSTNELSANEIFTNVKFDVIIDDAGPRNHVKTFDIYKDKLAPGGVYLIETFKSIKSNEVFQQLQKFKNGFSMDHFAVNGTEFIKCIKI